MNFLKPNHTCRTFNEYAEEYLSRLHRCACSGFQTSVEELSGGLDSFGVARVRARFEWKGIRRSRTLLLKRTPAGSPEARLHTEILPSAGVTMAPALLGVHQLEHEDIYIFEFVRGVARWPWSDTVHCGLVLQELAELHRKELTIFQNEEAYNDCLGAESLRLLEAFERAAPGSPVAFARKHKRLVQRIAEALPVIRRELMANTTFRSTLIHGDVHSGNIIMRRERGAARPVFLDWGRSRHGSPLEDVSSWLESLGFWEPEAKRRHDALLRQYLVCYRGEDNLTEEVRGLYWAAAACNVLAGAAIYHFSVAEDARRSPHERDSAVRSLADCIRVLRRGAAYWSSSGG
jgi:hypothetical protein